MADVHNQDGRSYNMSRIRSKNTKPEMTVRKFLHSKGFRYRLYDKKLPGKPDIVLPKYKTVVLIHGCFWHGHENCQYYKVPKTRTEWWLDKIEGNITRNLHHIKKLKEMGWRVIVIWECNLKPKLAETTLVLLSAKIKAHGLH